MLSVAIDARNKFVIDRMCTNYVDIGAKSNICMYQGQGIRALINDGEL